MQTDATLVQPPIDFEKECRIGLTRAADGLLVALRAGARALEAFGLDCTALSQGRTGDNVGFASAWLVVQDSGQMLAPLQLALAFTQTDWLSARVELTGRLLHAEAPYDLSLATLLLHRHTVLRAQQPPDAAVFYERSMQLLGEFSAEQLAQAVDRALAH